MSASSQTPPGALPPEAPPAQRPMAEAERDAYAAYGVAIPAPAGPAEQEAPASTSSVQLATGVIRKAMADGSATAEDIAQAEAAAGILFDPETAATIATDAYELARAEDRAELALAEQDREALDWLRLRWRAIGQLCEGRPDTDLLTVREVLTAADGTPPTGAPLAITWAPEQGVELSDGRLTGRTVVPCTTARGGSAALVLDDEQREKLATLLGLQVCDINAPCETPGCGEGADAEVSDLFGWSRLEIASLNQGPRWYCSDMCVFAALARAGHEQREDERQAELGGDL
ncbi:hypothetical protein ACIQJT_02275 [Streptomyces sp. NPDC091972]|uniref:hypothetical protein n=1 Tax=Streptomyces sp. NPDC091972 TaxID=3366007 RepID=UPI0038037033